MEFKSSLDIPHPLLVVTQTQLSKIFFKMLVIPLSICSITLIFDIKATLRNPFIGIRKWQDSDSQKSSLEFNFGFFFSCHEAQTQVLLLSKEMDIYDNTYVTQPCIIYVCQRFLPVLMSVIFHPLCAKNNESLLQNFPDIKKILIL